MFLQELGGALRCSPLSDKHSVRSVDTAVPDSDAEGPCQSDSGSSATDAEAGRLHEAREQLLSLRWAAAGACPQELQGFTATEDHGMPKVLWPPACLDLGLQGQQAPRPTASGAHAGTGSRKAGAGSRVGGLGEDRSRENETDHAHGTPAAQARCHRAPEQLEDFKRMVQSLLNKVCPENVGTISARIATLQVEEAGKLEILVELIFRKALAEPHYCETYADLVFSLQSAMPEFVPECGAGPALSLRTAILGVCQREFEGMTRAIEPTDAEKAEHDCEALELLRKARRDRVRANVRLIGHLYLRRLLAAKVVGRLASELTSCGREDTVPAEIAVECACELLLSVGHTLESTLPGAAVVQLVCERLDRLKEKKEDSEGKRGVYSRRVQFTIQDLLETRAAGWSKRSFKSSAKTKEDIRLQQERELLVARMPHGGGETPGAEHLVAGLRPAYLSLTPVAASS